MEPLCFISGGDPAAAVQGAEAEGAAHRELHSADGEDQAFVQDRLRRRGRLVEAHSGKK